MWQLVVIVIVLVVLVVLVYLCRTNDAGSNETRLERPSNRITREETSSSHLHASDSIDGIGYIPQGSRRHGIYQRASPVISKDIHSKQDLKQLLSKANEFVGRPRLVPLRYFYRDQTDHYYSSILNKHQGIMKVRPKDYHGDPKSPINGRLEGIFMGVNVQYGTSLPVAQSIYGPKRLLMDPERRYQECKNLYFADFYCVSEPHTVTLVMTRPGSTADHFCRTHLISLDWTDNSFLERRQRNSFYVNSSGLWVEVFFTENIDISAELYNLEDVSMIGHRSGGSTGFRKNPFCDICNI